MRRDLSARFWEKVDTTGDCWEWQAHKDPGGYGRIQIANVSRPSHRIAFELTHGPIPGGMHVDHVCLNRGCVNPEHLRLVTNKQNHENRDGARRDSASGVRGVTWHKHRKKWAVSVGHNGKRHHVGYFGSIEEAEAAAISARNDLFTHNAMDRRAA